VCRPLPVSIKNHAFFATVDFLSIWQVPAVPLATGLNGPIHSSANPSESDDIWAVFDDEVSDGGFEYDDDEAASPMEQPPDAASRPNNFLRRKSTKKKGQSSSAHFNGLMAAEAVQSVDGNINNGSGSHNRQNSSGSLEPPKAAYMDAGKAGRRSRWSSGTRSARTSSSSSGGNRTALTGLLETIGIHASGTSTGTPSQGNGTAGYGNSPRGSNRESRTSDRSDETRGISRTGTPLNQEAKW
jgi:3-phosphoinositide dependent protein kinase-1